MSVHLHARSCYTLLNSTLTVPQLVAQAKQAGYDAVACTDEKVMHGAMEFGNAAGGRNQADFRLGTDG